MGNFSKGNFGVKKLKNILINCMFAALIVIIPAHYLHADPNDKMLYSSYTDSLRVQVYADAIEPDIFWFIPHTKFMEKTDHMIDFEKSQFVTKPGYTEYNTWIMPSLSEEQYQIVHASVPGFVETSQLKPVIVKRLGLQVEDFGVINWSDEYSDYQYYNSPQRLKIQIPNNRVEEFEHFLYRDPGIKVNVLYDFMAEKNIKHAKINVTCSQVEEQLTNSEKVDLNVKGKAKGADLGLHTGADIQKAIKDTVYRTNVNLSVKGDIPGFQDWVNKILNECFDESSSNNNNNNNANCNNPTYVRLNPGKCPPSSNNTKTPTTDPQKSDPSNGDDGNGKPNPEDKGSSPPFIKLPAKLSTDLMGVESVKGMTSSAKNSLKLEDVLANQSLADVGDGGNGSSGFSLGSINLDGQYAYKKDNKYKDQYIDLKEIEYVDAELVKSVPMTLNLAVKQTSGNLHVSALPEHEFKVTYLNNANTPVNTGIIVDQDQQYTMNAVFSLKAKVSTNWKSEVQDCRTDMLEGVPTNDLYYRVGDSQWIPFDSIATGDKDNRVIIKNDNKFRGEIQLYLDREGLFRKVKPEYLKNGINKMKLSYDTTYPEFNVSVTGIQYQ